MNYSVIIIETSKIFMGIVIGTIFTTWYKDLKEKKEERKRLFLRMIAAKSYIQIPQMLVNDMNMIEVLFRGKKDILEKYRLYYSELCVTQEQTNYDKQKAYYWDLLRAIGNIVGYKNIDNKTLNSRYIPNVAFDEHLYSQEYKDTILRYLKTGNELQKVLIDLYRYKSNQVLPDENELSK